MKTFTTLATLAAAFALAGCVDNDADDDAATDTVVVPATSETTVVREAEDNNNNDDVAIDADDGTRVRAEIDDDPSLEVETD